MAKWAFQFKRKTPPENSKAPWTEKTCNWCKEQFWVIPSAAQHQVHCSSECSKAYRATTWEIVKCKKCGNVKKFPKSENRQFCGERCKHAFYKQENHPCWANARWRKCLNCEKEFYRFALNSSGRQVYSERKFCSSGCRIDYRRKNPYPMDAPHGKTIPDSDGYILMKVLGRGWVLQHRYVVEQWLGRRLDKSEFVHHRNGIKSDNRIENLQVMAPKAHKELHWEADKLGLQILSQDWIHPIEGIAV